MPEIVAAATKAAANRDAASQKNLADLVDKAKVLNNSLLSATTSPEDQIIAATAAVNNELLRLGNVFWLSTAQIRHVLCF